MLLAIFTLSHCCFTVSTGCKKACYRSLVRDLVLLREGKHTHTYPPTHISLGRRICDFSYINSSAEIIDELEDLLCLMHIY